jgi:hypothetical protein
MLYTNKYSSYLVLLSALRVLSTKRFCSLLSLLSYTKSTNY